MKFSLVWYLHSLIPPEWSVIFSLDFHHSLLIFLEGCQRNYVTSLFFILYERICKCLLRALQNQELFMPITQLSIFFSVQEKVWGCLLIKVLERVIVALNRVLYFPLLSLELPFTFYQATWGTASSQQSAEEWRHSDCHSSYCLKTSGNTFDSFVFTDSL